MSKNKKDLAAAKKAIAKKTQEFEKRMTDSKNDLERLQLLNDMEDLLQAEIYKWMDFLEKNADIEKKGHENLEKNVADQVGNLQSVVDSICAMRVEVLPNAKTLLEVKRRQHETIPPVKHIDYEPK